MGFFIVTRLLVGSKNRKPRPPLSPQEERKLAKEGFESLVGLALLIGGIAIGYGIITGGISLEKILEKAGYEPQVQNIIGK